MKRIQEIRLTELIIAYVGLFAIYVVLPDWLSVIRHIIAPIMAILIAIVFLNSLQYLRRG